MNKLNNCLILLSLLATNIYVANSYILDANQLNQQGYDTQSLFITVRDNDIESVDSSAFNGYSSLRELTISSDKLITIDLAVLKDSWTSLYSLTIASQSLIKISNSINAKFPKLKTFAVIGNLSKTVDIGNVINGLGNLTYLYLRFQQSALKPNQFSALSKLGQLELITPNQTSLTKAPFNGLTSLGILLLSNNNIKTIEVHTFENLSSVYALDLSYNLLTSFEYLQIPQNLYRLILSQNSMNYFKLSRTMLVLKELFISYNLFRSFKSMDFTFLANLTRLDLSYNPHAYPYEIQGHLKPLVKLEYVWLANLSISSLDSNYFQYNSKLRYIDLAENDITSLSNKTFVGLTDIRTIVLTNNKVATIEPGSFAGLPNLEEVYLDGNQLTQVDSSLFAGSNKLLSIFLKNNPNLPTANIQSICPATAPQCHVFY